MVNRRGRLSKNFGGIVFSISSYVAETLLRNIPNSKLITDDSDPNGEINFSIEYDEDICWLGGFCSLRFCYCHYRFPFGGWGAFLTRICTEILLVFHIFHINYSQKNHSFWEWFFLLSICVMTNQLFLGKVPNNLLNLLLLGLNHK